MNLATLQHTAESAVLCELCLGGYWCPDLPSDLFLSTVDRLILGVVRNLRERRFVKFGLSAVVAHVRKLDDPRILLERLAEITNPESVHWYDGENHLQYHLKKLVDLRAARASRIYAIDLLAATESHNPTDLPSPQQITDPTPLLMDRQWNLRKDRLWLENKPQKPALKLARA